MPRFLVIGSNSFSGAHCVNHLLACGDEVLGIGRSPEPDNVFLPYRWKGTPKHFTFLQADLNKDLEKIMSGIKTFRPEYIVNFAAQGMVAQSWQTPTDWYQTNVVAQVALHDQLRRMDFIRKYVHVTTPEVYGHTGDWIKEHWHFAPSTPYAVSRAACDMHLMSFFNAYQFPVVFTRAANVYGPGQQLYRIIPRAMLAARLGRKLPLHGGGHSERCFIHISDVCDATRRLAVDGKPGESYHISTRDPLSIRALVEKICALTGKNFSDVTQEDKERLGKDQAYLLDSEKIRALGWQDRLSLDAGLQETLAWVDNNIATLKNLPVEYIHKV